jgi:hypothetical protein
MQAKSDHKDALLATKNGEIQIASVNRQVEILTNQNKKYQNLTNEAVAKNENNERELATQKEIMKQFETSKKEYIAKLRRDIETIDGKYQEQINQLTMVQEDYYS